MTSEDGSSDTFRNELKVSQTRRTDRDNVIDRLRAVPVLACTSVGNRLAGSDDQF